MSTETGAGRLGRTHRVAVVALVAALLGLSACGDEGSTPEDPGSSSTDADGFTPPGTRLRLGETATVPRVDGDGVLAVTVTGIEAGDPADLDAFDDTGAKAQTPYYVSYELELVSGNGQGIAIRDYLGAWADGSQAGDLVVFRAFPRCQEVSLPLDAAPGTSVSSCKTYLVDEGGAPVDSVSFDNDDAYETGADTQITWQ